MAVMGRSGGQKGLWKLGSLPGGRGAGPDSNTPLRGREGECTCKRGRGAGLQTRGRLPCNDSVAYGLF